MKLNYNLQEITWDIEANNLLNEDTVNYLSSPYKLKDSFDMHCIVVEDHATGQLYGFHKGEKYVFDGRPYNEKDPELDYIYILENYTPIDYIHLPLESFKSFIQENPLSRVVAHNGINYDWLVTKLYYSMPYTVEPDSWCGKKLEIVDTLVMSKTLNPDRFGGHSLDKLSEKVGLRKIDFRPYVKKDDKFKTFAADMLYYCIRDVQVNTKVLRFLEREAGDWDWENAISLEKAVAEIVTRQEHRGFKFNTALAESNISELDALLEERRQKVEPVLPKRKATQAFLKEHTPPVNQLKVVEHKPPKQQFKKDGGLSAIMQKFIDTHGLALDLNRRVVVFEGDELKLPLNPDTPIKKDISLSSHMVSWVEKHNAAVSEDFSTIEVYGKTYPLPMPVEPIKHEMDAKIDDTTHIKEWLVGSFGWSPSEYKEKDLTVNSKKEKLSPIKYQEAVERYVQQTLNSSFCSDRCDFLGVTPSKLKARLLKVKEGRAMKVLTNPCFTRGQEKEICPNLELLSEKFPYAKDVVEYLTYKHRRNSILGGGLDWDGDEEPDKGYMAYVREDGRIPTPADTCGAATARFKHRCVANIPRITSLYGDKMRALFGVDEGFLQIGYDFDSLEAREEGHYTWKYDPTKEYCNSLLLEKPNDVHSVMARKISEIIKRDFGRSPAKSVKYAATYGATAPKIAKTIGESLPVGEVVFNAFWEAADPLKQLKDNLQKYWERVGGKKFILGIDGRKVPTRSAHAILNSLFQSAGVICAKRAMVIHDRLLKEEGLLVDFFVDDWKNKDFCQQLIAYHDESQLEVSRSLVKFRVVRIPNLEGKGEDEIKEIHKQLKTQIEDMKVKTESETQNIWSDIGHTDKMYYIAYSRAGELAAKAVKLSGEYYKLNVDLTAGYMVGTDWASCH